VKARLLILNWRDIRNPLAGGAEVFAYEIAKRLAKDNFEITWFASQHQALPHEELFNNIKIIRKGSWITVYLWAFFYYIFKFRNKTDIIIDCQNGIPFFTPLYSRKKIICVVHHVHKEIFKYYAPSYWMKYLGIFLESLMSIIYKKSVFVAVSPSTITAMQDLLHITSNINLIYNGIDHHFFTPGIKSTEPIILYLGRLKKYKKVDDLIKAFIEVTKKIPEAKCIIAGTGEEFEPLKKLVNDHELNSKVSFEGFVTEERKKVLLQQATVMVYPSVHEGWGISAIEANACGTPVIASNVSGLKDAVKDNETGLLYTVSDVQELAKKLELILTNTNLKTRLEKESVLWSKKFDWDQSYIQFKKLLE
jgi:glycosyltransferase involved in cell wall biosynthesis